MCRGEEGRIVKGGGEGRIDSNITWQWQLAQCQIEVIMKDDV